MNYKITKFLKKVLAHLIQLSVVTRLLKDLSEYGL